MLATMFGSQAHAQEALVGVCSGVSLPRSVVTDITGNVLAPVLSPVESLLGFLTGGVVNLNLSSALTAAAAGTPISLGVLDVNGNPVNLATTPQCVSQADGYTLRTPAGLAIGGNRIAGLGSAGLVATATEANAIAFGDSARTETGAIGAIALGAGAQVTATGPLGSVALGQNSLANGATLGDAAYLVGGTAAAEVNIGDRRLTGVSGGSADGDAVNVAQLRAATLGLTADALAFDTGLGAYSALRAGAATRITNVAPATLSATSTDAVNGAQLFATNDGVTANATNITNLGATVTNVGTAVTGLQANALLFDPALNAFTAERGGAPSTITNVAPATLSATSTDAVNGAQLFATNAQVGTNTTDIANLTTNIANGTADPLAVRYTDGAKGTLALGGAAGTTVTNLAAGAVTATSSDGINGAQLFATNGAVTTNATNITNLGNTVTGLSANALLYNAGINAFDATRGGAPSTITNVAPAALSATSSDAVTGAQLFATNGTVTTNTTDITNLGNTVTTLNTNVGGLQANALLFNPALNAFDAARGGAATVVTNVAPAALSATSTDAVNGTQLFGFGSSVANALGGSSSYNPATGQLTAGITYGGTTYGNVQGAVSAIETSVGTAIDANTRYFNANSVMADSQALGADSTAVGPNAIAAADGAIAAGRNTKAMSAGSVAIGDGSMTMSGLAVAIGSANVAAGNGAVAIGDPNIATGDGAIALGRDNQATGIGAVALGDTNFATGDGAVALGQTNQATGDGSVAIGATNLVTGTNAVAVGANNVVTGVEALAFGVRNQANGDGALAIGANIMTAGTDTLAVGNDTMAVGDSAAAYGNRAAATGLGSTALGTASTASAQYAVTLGQNANASAFASTALGTGAVASALGSVAVGTGSVASLQNSVALGGASSTSRGGVANYTAFGVAPAQTSLGEIAVGVSISYPDPITGVPLPVGERQITGVAAGNADTDAVNVSQLRGVSSTLGNAFVTSLGGGASYDGATGALTGPTYVINGATYTNVGDALAGVSGSVGQVASGAVTYDTGAKDLVTLAGATGTTVTNLTAGALTATSTDAVNGGQLFATNSQVGANTTAITNLQSSIANGTADPLAVRYTDAAKGTLALGGAAGTVVTNVAAGTIAATSTDAVNGAQLDATNQAVAAVDTRVTNLGTSVASSLGGGSVTNADGSVTAPAYQVAGVGAGGGATTATYNDVGSAISGLGTSIGNVNTRIDTINAVSERAVTYDGAPGSARDTITLAGAAGTRLTNVTAGAVNATSTDAVNGAQLNAVGQQVAANTTSIATNTTNITRLQNGTAGYFQVNNTAGNPTPVASGTNSLAAGGGATSAGANAVALGTAASAGGTNSVALGAGSVADRANSVSVGNATATRQITNLAAGTMATDAVNLAQLTSGMNQTLAAANGYTDVRLNQVGFDLRELRRDANGGTAAAMALATIPQAYGPGMGMIGGGVSTWGGQQAFALGVSKATADGGVVVKAGATINTRGKGGGAAGVGFAF